MPNGLVVGGVSFPLLAPDGSASAPSYSFLNDTNTGMWWIGSDNLGFSVGGTTRVAMTTAALITTVPVQSSDGSALAPAFSFYSTQNSGLMKSTIDGSIVWVRQGVAAGRLDYGLVVRGDYPIGFCATGTSEGAADVTLYRDAANVLAQRNSTNAQTFRLYETYTDASNYSRLALYQSSTEFWVETQRAGTGVARNLVLRAAGATMYMGVNGTYQWFIGGGHLLAAPDDTYDIGASNATRPRSLYVATSITVNRVSGSDASIIYMGAGGVNYALFGSNPNGAYDFFISGLSNPNLNTYLVSSTGTVSQSFLDSRSMIFSAYAGNGVLTSTPLTLTSTTVNIFNGSKTAPAITFAASTTRGLYAYQSGIAWGNGFDQEWSFSSNEAYLRMGSFGLAFSSGGNGDSTVDLLLKQLGAASLRQGMAPSATPVAQTFTIGEASRPGTDTNVGGANGTIRSGLGTGTGAASSIVFQTPTLVASGSTTQTYADRLTVATAGITATVPVIIPVGDATNPGLGITGHTDHGITWGAGCNGPMLVASGSPFFANSGLNGVWAQCLALVFSAAINGSGDTVLARLSSASLRLGSSPSATPVAQTFTIGEFSRVGTDNNVAGSDGTIRSGSGTGNAAGSSLFFDTPTVGASGTVQQSYGHRLTLSALGATFDIPDQGLRINNQVNGAGASAGTLTNAPSAGNPNFWLPISIAGVTRYFPGW